MYKGKTPIYNIPYLKDGDKIQEKIEKQRALAIENLLFAGNCGVPKVIFEDGDYDIYEVDDTNFILTITAENEYAVLGILNHRLFYSHKPIVFDGLTKNNFYFIYVAYQTELNIDATRFRRVLSPTIKDSDKYLLLATVDLRGDEPVINENPDDKKYTKDILGHITDSTNPHGRNLHQDKLTIHDNLWINENEVYETVYVDGEFGKAIEVEKTPVFVSVMPTSSNYGEFWVEINEKIVTVKGMNDGTFKAEIKVK